MSDGLGSDSSDSINDRICPRCGKPAHDGECQGDAAWAEATKERDKISEITRRGGKWWISEEWLAPLLRRFARQAVHKAYTEWLKTEIFNHERLEDAARRVVGQYERARRYVESQQQWVPDGFHITTSALARLSDALAAGQAKKGGGGE